MRGVLACPYRESDGIMAIREDIADGDAEGVPAVRQCRFLLEKIGATEKGIKATATGNLPRALAVEFYNEFKRAEERYAISPASENDVPLLGKAKFALRSLGLIKFALGRYTLTKKGRALLEHLHPGLVLP
jgi:predicted methyltransferase